MRKPAFLLLIILVTLNISGCNCSGVNETYTTTGIEMITPATYSAASSAPAIEILETTITEKGLQYFQAWMR